MIKVASNQTFQVMSDTFQVWITTLVETFHSARSLKNLLRFRFCKSSSKNGSI
jgi:hypothetical protein